MKIVVAGGGPAGLTFARLAKLRHPKWHVSLAERGRADATYGWGITLPRQMLAQLEAADPATAVQIGAASVRWDQIHVYQRGRRVDLTGTPLLGISRLTLLDILQNACRAAGVQLAFESPIDPVALPACDLLVAADGARSAIRTAGAESFGTTAHEGGNRYLWLGTPCVFAGLAFAVAETEYGPLVAHGYPFSPDASTFVVECGEDAWQRAGLAGRTAEDTCTWLAAAFADVLRGAPLLCPGVIRWMRFLHVRNETWTRDRIVLVGDAAHAVHFSVGSGTLLAIADAIALARALDDDAMLDAALEAFADARIAALAAFQTLEARTVARLEQMDQLAALEPLELAYQLLTR